jgi:hypothetical protein
MVPPNGGPILLLHGEDFSSESYIDQYHYRLPTGEYKISLTSQRSPGILQMFFHLP